MYLKTITFIFSIIQVFSGVSDAKRPSKGFGTILPFASCEPTDCNISWNSSSGVIYARAENAWDGTKIWATGKHSYRCSLGSLEEWFGRKQFKSAESTFIKSKDGEYMLSQRCAHGTGTQDCLGYWYDDGIVYRPTVNGVPGGLVNAFTITNECIRSCSDKTKTMTYCKVKSNGKYLKSRPSSSCGNGDLFGLEGDGFVYLALGTSSCMK